MRSTNWSACRRPCPTVLLDIQAPNNVRNLFKDVSQELKGVFKNLDFQERQKKQLIEYKEKKYQETLEKFKEKQVEHRKVEEVLQQRKSQLNHLEQKEAALKAEVNRLTSSGRTEPKHHQGQHHQQHGNMSSAFYAGMAELSPARSNLAAPFLDSSLRSAGSGGSRGRREGVGLASGSAFLNMKTPGRWYNSKGPLDNASPKEGRRPGDPKAGGRSPFGF